MSLTTDLFCDYLHLIFYKNYISSESFEEQISYKLLNKYGAQSGE